MNARKPRIELPMINEAAVDPAPPSEPSPPPPEALKLTPEQVLALEQKIVAALKTCYDPEIPVNIYELGLVYQVEVSPGGVVAIRMTLTSPACPAAGSLPPEVRHKVEDIPGVTAAKVDVVWDPPWTPDRMSEAAKLQLGIYDY
jgi:FeS assembly SUF system protein